MGLAYHFSTMSRKNSQKSSGSSVGSASPLAYNDFRTVPWVSGTIVSRSNEPSPGWRGILTQVLENVLIFESDPSCSPMLPTLLPAFSLISPSFPDSPGSARVSWGQEESLEQLEAPVVGDAARWLPRKLRERLKPGLILEHDASTGRSLWRLEGLATIVEGPTVARPRLVLAPPRRRDPRVVQRATISSLFRAMRSVPPESDLERLVEVSRAFFSEEPDPRLIETTVSLADLVGYGAGRTPCGDDYLVGFICGLDLSASLDPRVDPTYFHEYRVEFVGSIHRVVGRTSLLGRQILLAAFHGLYSAPLLDEADALSDGIIVGPGEPEWTLLRRPTASPGWPALLGMLTGAYVVGVAEQLRRRPEHTLWTGYR